MTHKPEEKSMTPCASNGKATQMQTLLVVLAAGYITLVLSGGIAHHPIRAKHGRRR
jgi:hypothetical protein